MSSPNIEHRTRFRRQSDSARGKTCPERETAGVGRIVRYIEGEAGQGGGAPLVPCLCREVSWLGNQARSRGLLSVSTHRPSGFSTVSPMLLAVRPISTARSPPLCLAGRTSSWRNIRSFIRSISSRRNCRRSPPRQGRSRTGRQGLRLHQRCASQRIQLRPGSIREMRSAAVERPQRETVSGTWPMTFRVSR